MSRQDRWLLPEGVEEMLPPRAAALEQLRREVLDLYRTWGYELVIPPLIEYLESLLTGTGNDLDLQTFKLTDQLSGRLMGVRADITPQVARMDANRLAGTGPRRLCYVATVLHTRPGGLAQSRAPLQTGAELFGHAGLESDLEVVSLMLETLSLAGLEDVHLDVGHVGVYRELARAAGLDAEAEADLFGIMQRKAAPELDEFFAGLSVPAKVERLLRALPELNGGPEAVGEAREALRDAPGAVSRALDDVDRLLGRLRERFPDLPVHVDFSELRGYHYHTGVVFAAFQAGHGQSVARGGRYDHVGEVFGRARPATGYSADLKTLLERSRRSFVREDEGVLAPPDEDPALEAEIRRLRAEGRRVVRMLPGAETPPESAGCPRRLVRRGGRWRIE